MGDRDDDALVGDEVLDGHLALVGDDLGAALVAVLVADDDEFLLDDGEHADFLGENVHEIADLFEEFLIVADDLVALEAGELIEAQLEDGGDLLGADEVATVGEASLVVDHDAEASRPSRGVKL